MATVTDNPGESRYELHTDDGQRAGFAAYKKGPGAIAFNHTEVDDRFEGQGLGSELARAALDSARSEGLAVLPFCPFIKSWIARHPDYLDLVPEDQRARFGL